MGLFYSMIDRIVGMNIAILRRQRGLTVDQMAVLSGVSADTIVDIEQGAHRLTGTEVIDILEALHVTVHQLYEGARGMAPIDLEALISGKRAPNS